MEDLHCPDYNICRLVHTTSIVSDSQRKLFYLHAYCIRGDEAWSSCKRYIAKNTLNFCPDFVLPDSLLSPSEVIDEFDRLSGNDY